ncbi:MAG: peroxiredoxin [Rickettsiales bacterium]
MPSLVTGASCPLFRLPTDNGGLLSLADLKGSPFVLFFYPKDDTPGCTTEALAFKELKSEFDALGVKIIGLSKDSVASHQKYKEKHALPFALLSDESTDFIQSCGAWGEKSLYGKKYMGTERCTFLIDADGRAVRVWENVKVPGHAEEVLEASRKLCA